MHPGPRTVAIDNVVCRALRSCMAVGDHRGRPAFLSWDGRTWTRRTIPRTYRDDTGRVIRWAPWSIACTSTRRCIVVGDTMTVGRWHNGVFTLGRVGGRRLLRTHGWLRAVDCVPRSRRCLVTGTSGGPKAVAAVGRS